MKSGIETGLVEHVLTLEEETMLAMDPDAEELIEFFKRFKPGEYYDHGFRISNHAVQNMESYIGILRKSGLDIGKGNMEFGYKMPPPKEGKKNYGNRYLRIFRRR